MCCAYWSKKMEIDLGCFSAILKRRLVLLFLWNGSNVILGYPCSASFTRKQQKTIKNKSHTTIPKCITPNPSPYLASFPYKYLTNPFPKLSSTLHQLPWRPTPHLDHIKVMHIVGVQNSSNRNLSLSTTVPLPPKITGFCFLPAKKKRPDAKKVMQLWSGLWDW